MTDAVDRWVSRLEAMESPDAIAEFLTELGIKGHRGGSNNCPIAMLLRVKTDISYLEVHPTRVAYTNRKLESVNEVIPYTRIISVIEPLSEFIRKFDHGDYPALAWGVQGGSGNDHG